MPDQNTLRDDFNDEILVLDESGEFKLLSEGELKSYDSKLDLPARSRSFASAKAGIRNSKFETEAPAASPKPSAAMLDTGMEEKMLQPPPPLVRKETASFYFHPQDEEEAAKAHLPKDLLPQKQYSLDKIYLKVTDSFKLALSDELKKRLRTVIYTYLRDRRTLVDAAEALKRTQLAGGVELAGELADRILIFLKEIKEKIIQERGIVIDEQIEKPAAFSAVFKKAPSAGEKLALPEKKVVLSQTPAFKEEKAQQTPFPQAIARPMPQIMRPVADIQGLKPSLLSRSFPKGRSMIADIQKDYKLVGPVEELSSLSLVTFRRLGPATHEQARKILAKVNLLGEDSLVKKAAGIQGWRKSPLYKMYLAIGQASLEHGLSVAAIISQYRSQGKEIMTMEEFEAISDLNKLLRF